LPLNYFVQPSEILLSSIVDLLLSSNSGLWSLAICPLSIFSTSFMSLLHWPLSTSQNQPTLSLTGQSVTKLLSTTLKDFDQHNCSASIFLHWPLITSTMYFVHTLRVFCVSSSLALICSLSQSLMCFPSHRKSMNFSFLIYFTHTLLNPSNILLHWKSQ
jgi:hypothetical protein